jgi:methylenetetrahydrofolate reductase (NADPH)
MKIIDKINEKLKNNEKFYSFEYFPPKTEGGIENLLERIERMALLNPLWVDMTWGAGGTTTESTLFLSSYIQNYINLDVLMHITCRCLTKEKIDEALEEAKNNGIMNLLALRGDPPQGTTYDPSNDYFQYAEDLVSYIREKYGDYFCICVAGYPATHVESKSRDEDLLYLKRKVDAGSDFIITQLFYDVDEFLDYVKACREYGITCPILPGLLPIQNYNSFKKIINLCRISTPQELSETVEKVKNDDEKIKEVGIDNCVEMCKKLLDNGINGIHYYTMNLEKSVNETLKKLDFKIQGKQRELPWKKHSNPKRTAETVRPIFWKNNSKSYLSKTWYWDEFPNGIWGDSRSPAFGNLEEHFVSFCKDYLKETKKFKQLKKIWGDKLASYEDISNVFFNYIEGKIKKLPWCQEMELQSEIVYLKDLLYSLNHHKIFTINSQPAVNGKPSNDPYVGWGPSDGYVYQKMYVEFFIDKSQLDKLISIIPKYPFITYQAVNRQGDIIQKNQQSMVIALTWGVFPNREIVQPTIYDSEVFLVWKEEAFNLWNEWIRIYEEDDEKSTESANLLKTIQNEFYLMTLIDNDYINPQVEVLMKEFISIL